MTTKTEYYIIGDIAGEYYTLMNLVAKLRPEVKIILAGDLVDRGPDSDKVVNWAMNNSDRVITLLGNHEDMMLDALKNTKRYYQGCWFTNGGSSTFRSFGCFEDFEIKNKIINWVESLPLYFIEDGLFVSHAPIHNSYNGSYKRASKGLAHDNSIIWNRTKPKPIDGLLQVAGHNSHWGLLYLGRTTEPYNDYFISIDTSRARILTALHYPYLKVIDEPYAEQEI